MLNTSESIQMHGRLILLKGELSDFDALRSFVRPSVSVCSVPSAAKASWEARGTRPRR